MLLSEFSQQGSMKAYVIMSHRLMHARESVRSNKSEDDQRDMTVQVCLCSCFLLVDKDIHNLKLIPVKFYVLRASVKVFLKQNFLFSKIETILITTG